MAVELAEKRCTGCGETKPLSQFNPRPNRPGGRHSRCKTCLNIYHRSHYAKNREHIKAVQAPYREGRRKQYQAYSDAHRARKRIFIDSLRTPCVACGESRRAVLDFHHMDSSEKAFTMTTLPGRTKDVIRAEIAKCVSLCANCHRLLHAGDQTVRQAAHRAYALMSGG